jgi:DNA topoisomerase IB
MRLTTSDPTRPGLTRKACGRGFRYLSADGAAVQDRETVARIKALVIPPAWTDVWICP